MEGVANGSGTGTSDSQTDLLRPVVSVNRLKKKTGYINTVWAALLLVLLSISCMSFGVALFFHWPNWIHCRDYFWALHFQVGLWSVTFLVDFYLKRKHEESRIDGYLEFFNKSMGHARCSFYVITCGNAILLGICASFNENFLSIEDICKPNIFSPINCVAFILVIENVINICILISYIVKICKFNNQRSCPDAQRDDWMANFIQESYSGGEIGLIEREYMVEDLLEKQADLLRHLKEHNARLLQKVIVLSSQLQERHGSQIT